MVKSSCKDCEKRHLGCHSNCEDYKRFIEEQKETRKYNNSFRPRLNHNQIYPKGFIKKYHSA